MSQMFKYQVYAYFTYHLSLGVDPGYVKRGGWDPKGGQVADIAQK